MILAEEPSVEHSFTDNDLYGDPEEPQERVGYLGQMLFLEVYDAGPMNAEATERTEMLKQTSRSKKWIKFIFKEDIHLTNEVYSPDSRSEVEPIPIPLALPEKTLGRGTNKEMSFTGCATRMIWKVAIDKSQRALAPGNRDANRAGAKFRAMFGGTS